MKRNLLIFSLSVFVFHIVLYGVGFKGGVASNNYLVTYVITIPFVIGVISYSFYKGEAWERIAMASGATVLPIFLIGYYQDTEGFHISYFLPAMLFAALGAGFVKVIQLVSIKYSRHNV